jgi:hypothetical protein
VGQVGRRKMGQAQENNPDFDLNQNFELNKI